jgi:signal transduction histidine kinase/HAMP domain-containing protein
VTPIHLLLIEGLALLLLELDLAHDYQLLSSGSRACLLLLAATALGACAWPRLRARSGPAARRVVVALGAGALAVATLGTAAQLRTRALASSWESGAGARLERRAALLQEDIRAWLDRIAQAVLAGRAPVGSAAEGFAALGRVRLPESLPAERLGLSIYRPDGSLLAWTGNSADPPAGLLDGAGETPRFVLGGEHTSPRLYVVSREPVDGSFWVGEFVLRPAMAANDEAAGPKLGFLPHWDDIAPAHVHLGGGHHGIDDLAAFFRRQGDRYWGRLGREGVQTLSVPLRAPDGSALAVATLIERRIGQALRAQRRRLRLTGALLAAAALLAATLLLARPAAGYPPRLRLAAGMGGLAVVRIALLLMAPTSDLPRGSLFDVSLFASGALGGLLRSPADLLLTALTCLGAAWLARCFLIRLEVPASAGRRARLARVLFIALPLLGVAAAAGLPAALDRLVLDTRLDLSRFDFDAHLLPRAALQASLFLLVTAAALLLAGLWDLGLRCLPPGRRLTTLLLPLRGGALGRLPLVLRAALGVLLLTLLYVPFLHLAYDRLRQAFFESELLPRVVDQQERRERVLRDALGRAGQPEFGAAARFAAEGPGRADGAAYRLWTMTPLAEMGLASSLQVFGSGGNLLGRFAVNLAPMLEIPFETARDAAGRDPIEVAPGPRVTVRQPVLFGSRWVRAPRQPPLLVVMTVVDSYDNLPMLGAETSYLKLFRASDLPRSNPDLVRFDPLVAVFGRHLERLYESGGEIPPPPPEALRRLRVAPVAWTTDDVGDGIARIVYARAPEGNLVALAEPHASRIGLLAGYLRLFLFNGLVAALLLALLRLTRRPAATATAERAPGATFYARLVATVMLSAMVPLLALAYFVTRFSTREFNREIIRSGLGSLQVVRRVAEDYLTVSAGEEGGGPALDDDMVFWLSRVVRQDLSIYAGATLQATSVRELYSSGLLNTRLGGRIDRALYIEREPFVVAEQRAGTTSYLTLSAPTRIDRNGSIGVLSIPLASQTRAVSRKIGEVEDAILISTCVTVLLLAAVAWRVARRVSGPIVLLARAARRVADGDLEVRVAMPARDEVGELVDAFNRMAASLRAQRDDLRRRGDYIEKILRGATTGVVSIDAAGAVVTINPAAQRLLRGDGPAPPEVGAHLSGYLQRHATLQPLGEALQQALQAPRDSDREIAIADPGGERRLRAAFIPFAPEEHRSPGRIILLEDVTGIVRSGRLAAWAEMARRIAHEIKNPLTPIQLSVEHLRRLWEARDSRFGETLRDCLDNIQRQVRVLREIATEFSAYARLPHLRSEPTSLEAILDGALGPYAAAPPPGVELRRDLPADLPLLQADPAVLGRVLVNLFENALQAMPSGGILSVSAAVTPGSAGEEMVRIEVGDTGVGIDPSLLPRLFEPYFSTKSSGTGLGLAIVRQAIEEHGGTIDIRSTPGAGTVVRLTLPAAPSGAARRSP